MIVYTLNLKRITLAFVGMEGWKEEDHLRIAYYFWHIMLAAFTKIEIIEAMGKEKKICCFTEFVMN
jgi:hypothetical protein